jgi:SAM-dependent methyltransferase
MPGVNLVGDGERLPLADGCFDVVLAKAVLEHVRDAPAVVAEAHRVLKPGGFFYVELPFLYEYHPNPGDYLRLTRDGLKQLLGAFHEVECGSLLGPGQAMASLAAHGLALGLSLGRLSLFKFVHPFLTWLTAPLALLDLLLVPMAGSHAVAHHLWALARKASD